MKLALTAVALALAVTLGAAGRQNGPTTAVFDGRGPLAHVLVELSAPPLARAGMQDRGARAAIDTEQRRFADALEQTIPRARIHWRYRLVANGVSVVLPRRAIPALGDLPGVADVFPDVTYRSLAGPAGAAIRARPLPGLDPVKGGAGIKIGIIDDGVDQTHPFFSPAGYVMPPGFPKGQVRFTTAKVIAARSFPPPGATYAPARLAFDEGDSGHGTHVAGIAAGNADTPAEGSRISGVAPRAYLGNYRALTIPTDADVGLDGNAPEIVAAIEAAVADGMDVINLSLGEPEIEPTRDVVALALDAAAEAGVVPVVAAGNDFDDFGYGSVSSPGTSDRAITVAAVSAEAPYAVAGFSSAGPTPLSLRLKPDLAAPGASILSSVPEEGWGVSGGTSMAAPHVAGAAALLLQRHPEWTPADVKGALVGTARPLKDGGVAVAPVRGGAGLTDVTAADSALLAADPPNVSFGMLDDGEVATAAVDVRDLGTGAGDWTVEIERLGPAAGAVVRAPSTVTVPGTIELAVRVGPKALDGDVSGFVVLRRGADTHRVPFWGRLATPALGASKRMLLRGPGTYGGDTREGRARVSTYRYPTLSGEDAPVEPVLRGLEQVFRVRIGKPLANLGVVIVSRSQGARIEPRIVMAGDENRLAGYAALPFNLNPYLANFFEPVPAAGVLSPLPGAYDIVFDSRTRAGAGRFTFRYWVNDVTPPSVVLLTRSVKQGESLRLRATDGGSGVDPHTVRARIDGDEVDVVARNGLVSVAAGDLSPGRHVLRVQVSDYQESRNMENVARILPNTRVVRTSFTVTRR